MLNRVTLIGRISTDLREPNKINGRSQIYFNLAINSGFGENKTTQFVPCVAWEKNAENISRFLKKGSLIYVDGRLNLWKNKENITNTQVNIVTVIFLDSRNKEMTSSDNFSKNNAFTNQKVNEADFDIDNISFDFIENNKNNINEHNQEKNNQNHNEGEFNEQDQAIVWE